MKGQLFLATKFIKPTTAKETIWIAGFRDKMRLADRYGVVLVRAGAGYGKSIMLSKYFTEFRQEHCWMTITEEDAELPVFLKNLLLSIHMYRPEVAEEALRVLDSSEDPTTSWKYVLNALINDLHALAHHGEVYLVLEDYHLVQGSPENDSAVAYLLHNIPPGIHVILTSRRPYSFLPVSEWKLKGKALVIDEADLAFSERETMQFLRIRTGRRLTPQEAAQVREMTEGWAIAVEMIAESITNSGSIPGVASNLREDSRDLFRFLATAVLERQPPHVRQFVLQSSILRSLNQRVCSHLFGPAGKELLQEVLHRGLLLQHYGNETYGFHRLFREFLLYTAEQEGMDIQALSRTVAAYYLAEGMREQAVEYLIQGADYEQAATLIPQIAPEMIKNARFRTLLAWLDALPPYLYSQKPALYLLKGDVKRSVSGFHEASHLYQKAQEIYRSRGDQYGQADTLTRKALVFLDTVQPGQAEPLLQQALHIKERINDDGAVHLRQLIAENNLNQGRMEQAAALIAQMREQGIAPNPMGEARWLLRTGRLHDAVAFTETCLANQEYLRDKAPKSHRELRLVLSLLFSLQGERTQESMELAREVLLTSRRVGSRFTESVAAARLGHFHQVDGDLEKAIYWYRKAVTLADDVRVPRGKGEPLWGLTLAYGFRNDPGNCRLYGDTGATICSDANDWWLLALTRMGRGVGHYVHQQYPEALSVLRLARQGFVQTGDAFGQTVSLLWEGMTCWRMGDSHGMQMAVGSMFRLMDTHMYHFLLERKSLWSPRDMGELKRFLHECKRLGAPGLEGVEAEYHPGYTLRVRTLGPFGVCRGTETVAPSEWTRDKAKRMLQILLSHRGQMLFRDTLTDILWPDKTGDSGLKNFKVTLSTLNKILEPEHPEDLTHFTQRAGDRYGLIIENLDVDADRFARLAHRGLQYVKDGLPDHAKEALEQALGLYTGDFLEDVRYEEWVEAERGRLQQLYLEAADALAQIYLSRGRYERCLALCEQILGRDDCWENAYRLQILCHATTGEKARAVQSYRRCKEALHRNLGVRPSQETIASLKKSIHNL